MSQTYYVFSHDSGMDSVGWLIGWSTTLTQTETNQQLTECIDIYVHSCLPGIR